MRSKTSQGWSRPLLNLFSHNLIPEDASGYERDHLLQREERAKTPNDARDEKIPRKRDKAETERQMRVIRVLLLGQSESGKTTVLNQFRQRLAPLAFNQERTKWRAVVYLNLIRSVSRILDALVPPDYSPAYHPDAYTHESGEIDSPPHNDGTHASSSQSLRFQCYVKYLSPLFVLERYLIRQLAFPDEDNDPPRSLPSHIGPPVSASQTLHTKSGERALRLTSHSEESLTSLSGDESGSAHSGEIRRWWEDPRDPVHVLQQCVNGEYGVRALWRDVEVRNILERRRMWMGESSGFYLNDIDRITALRYIPTDDDVLRAYLKTTSVVGHSLIVKGGDPTTKEDIECRIYDTGGARQQRQAWASYLGDVDLIVFLSPISAFDQTLEEDPRVNRLEDSMVLWRSLVSNKLLASTSIILFLSKCDLLKVKLERGASVTTHIPSYRGCPGDYKSVCEYLRRKFTGYYKPSRRREIYLHFTSFVTKHLPTVIISCVKDIVLRQNLLCSRLL